MQTIIFIRNCHANDRQGKLNVYAKTAPGSMPKSRVRERPVKRIRRAYASLETSSFFFVFLVSVSGGSIPLMIIATQTIAVAAAAAIAAYITAF